MDTLPPSGTAAQSVAARVDSSNPEDCAADGRTLASAVAQAPGFNKIDTWGKASSALIQLSPLCVDVTPSRAALAPFKKKSRVMHERLSSGLPTGWVLLSLQPRCMKESVMRDVWVAVALTMGLVDHGDVHLGTRNRKRLALFTDSGWKAFEGIAKVRSG